MTTAFAPKSEFAFRRRNEEYEEALGHRIAEHDIYSHRELLKMPGIMNSKIMEGYYGHRINKQDSEAEAEEDKRKGHK